MLVYMSPITIDFGPWFTYVLCILYSRGRQTVHSHPKHVWQCGHDFPDGHEVLR